MYIPAMRMYIIWMAAILIPSWSSVEQMEGYPRRVHQSAVGFGKHVEPWWGRMTKLDPKENQTT